jgi:hypothetical protein
MNISAIANNQYAIFVKDYWVILVAFCAGLFLIIKYLIKSAMKIDKIPRIVNDIETLQKDTMFIKGKLTSIERLLKSIVSGSQATNQIANKYGIAHSPISLKKEFKEYVLMPQLDKQITKRNKELLQWLQEQKPKTGLDAQDDITEFVISNAVSQYLDLTDFRQHLYKKGKTSQDANGILIVYLFEILIPQLDLADERKKKKKIIKK